MEAQELMEESRRELAEKFMREAHSAVEAAREKRAGASYRDLMIGAGVAVDKAQILTGQPSQITAQVDARQTAERALERLLELARQRDPGVTREQVRERLLRLKPELEPLLLPA